MNLPYLFYRLATVWGAALFSSTLSFTFLNQRRLLFQLRRYLFDSLVLFFDSWMRFEELVALGTGVGINYA